MSVVNITIDQHRLVLDSKSAIVQKPGSESFPVYDELTKDFVYVSQDSMDDTIALLGSKAAVILSEEQVKALYASPSTGVSEVNESASCSQKTSGEIWLKNCGKPSNIDVQARDDLILLMKSEKIQSLLKDKKTTKISVFAQIAKILEEKGYSFGERDGAKVCQQKWKNLEAETLKFIANAGPKNTGGRAIRKPEYFEEMFDVVKDTAKAFPKNVQDSLDDEATPNCGEGPSKQVNDDEDVDDEEEEKVPTSPFLKVKTSAKPARTNNAEILAFLKEDAAKKEAQTEKLINLFQKKAKQENKRKKAFLHVLKALAGGKKKKTKEGSSSEDSSPESSESES